MSDTTDRAERWKRRLRGDSGTSPLQAAMKEFLAEHPARADLKSLREELRGGTDMSEIVKKGREERV